MVDDLRWASALSVAAAIRSGELGPAEVRDAALERIDRFDADLGSVVIDLRERNLPPADGPFRGVPTLLKDAGEELAGTPTWVGTRALRAEGPLSSTTTPFAARLESLGFAIVGRSACPELSAGASTEPPGFSPTRNPWDLSLSAGGSSGGSAAAVAAGLVSLAHGSDATGSLRYPAACCGVVTLKPSRGRVGCAGAAGGPDPAGVWTQFALARHVEDLTALFAGVAEPWPGRRVGLGPQRAGVVVDDAVTGHPTHPATAAGVRAIAGHLGLLGWRVDPEAPSPQRPLTRREWHAMATFADHVRGVQVRWVAERTGRPPQLGDLSGSVLEAAARGSALGPEDVSTAAATFAAAFAATPRWWDERELLVCPVTLDPAWPIGEPADPHCGMFCLPFSFTGQPAVVVPSGVFHDGVPIGVQLIGRVGSDEALLALAAELQTVVGWTAWRPGRTGTVTSDAFEP